MTTADILQVMRKRLKITWANEIEDANIEMMIASGVAYLNGSAGEDIDFEADSFALELLYVYTMYARNDSIAAFREAYAPDLLKLHLQYKARRVKGESDNATEE